MVLGRSSESTNQFDAIGILMHARSHHRHRHKAANQEAVMFKTLVGLQSKVTVRCDYVDCAAAAALMAVMAINRN